MTLVVNTRVNSTSYSHATGIILDWSTRGESRYICAANVHVLMEAYDSPEYNRMVNSADLVTPDGMPLVWMMRLKGQRGQSRVYGPDLMLHVLGAAEREHISVGFYGSTPQVLESLVKRMQVDFADLSVKFLYSPPYRDLDANEDSEVIQNIDRSGARILFVGLGCPKQERWMAEHQGKISCVMIGVGAAFDFLSETKPQAPTWIQQMGMEWFYRLVTEPGRLWKRYLYHNSRFVVLAIADLLGLVR